MRTATCLFFLLALLACKPTVKDPDLVAWWSFDDATPTLVPDQSVHSLNAVNKGAILVEGKSGKALQFDGKSVLQVDYQPILDDFQNGITVMAWIKKDTASHWNTIVSREIESGWSEYIGLAIYKNQALFSIDQDGTNYKNISDNEFIQPNVWYHLAGTFDNTTFNLYVNGKLIKTGYTKGNFKFNDQNPLLIGGNSNNQNLSLVDCFKGTLDEVRIYKRAFSIAEINKLMK
jgi:hypothetical protein